MFDLMAPFYPRFWRSLMRRLKKSGHFKELAVKNLNTDFMYQLSVMIGLGGACLWPSQAPFLAYIVMAVVLYVMWGFSFRANLRQMYLYNRAQVRRARVVTEVMLGTTHAYHRYFEYEYMTAQGIERARCRFALGKRGLDSFYSEIYNGAEILILVDERDEGLSVVPTRTEEVKFRLDASRSLYDVLAQGGDTALLKWDSHASY